MKIVTTTKGRLTPLQRAYCLGYRRCLLRIRRELKDMIDHELADMKDVVDGIERDYENARAFARAMAERDPEVRLHSKIKRRWQGVGAASSAVPLAALPVFIFNPVEQYRYCDNERSNASDGK